jgi:hypothetical protein
LSRSQEYKTTVFPSALNAAWKLFEISFDAAQQMAGGPGRAAPAPRPV